MQSGAAVQVPTWAWIALAVAVLSMLALDLWAFRGERAESRRATRNWTVGWIALGLAFGGFVWLLLGGRLAQEYYAAYAIEKGLSLDNLFLFYVVFRTLGVPRSAEHKILFWGILGAIGFRALFIFVGVEAIERWEWVSYLFGALLLYAAWQAFRKDPSEQKESRVARWLAERLPVTSDTDDGTFIARRDGRRAATPLLLALIAIELTDVVMAIDSVPAALAISRNRFVVYSSNILAVMGLRALYLYLSSVLIELRYLHYGLAAVLAFAAVKIVTDDWFEVPPLASVGVIIAFIGSSVWASLRARNSSDDST